MRPLAVVAASTAVDSATDWDMDSCGRTATGQWAVAVMESLRQQVSSPWLLLLFASGRTAVDEIRVVRRRPTAPGKGHQLMLLKPGCDRIIRVSRAESGLETSGTPGAAKQWWSRMPAKLGTPRMLARSSTRSAQSGGRWRAHATT